MAFIEQIKEKQLAGTQTARLRAMGKTLSKDNRVSLIKMATNETCLVFTYFHY